jgi:hypothetical protein
MKFSFFKRSGSAPVARERLQILLAHERMEGTQVQGQGDVDGLVGGKDRSVVGHGAETALPT